MKLVNICPHDVRVVEWNLGHEYLREVLFLPAQDDIEEPSVHWDERVIRLNGIRVLQQTYSTIEHPPPPPEDGVYYLVSHTVYDHPSLRTRSDLLYADPRDHVDDGKTRGYLRLRRLMPEVIS